MPYSVDDKLVVGVAASALFRLDEADAVFRREGLAAYRAYQRSHETAVLEPGVVFPFVRRLLMLNAMFPGAKPVEVALLSRNDPDTGSRVFHSIAAHNLDITRAAFTGGDSPFRFISSFNIALFLTANPDDAREAISLGHPAGIVLDGGTFDEPGDSELRIAFDFDGVIADDAAENVFQQHGLAAFAESESAKAQTPHAPGPLARLFRLLGSLRQLESQRLAADPQCRRFLKTAIVTARDTLTARRVVTTLRSWNIIADQTFFLGGIAKAKVLSEWRPHIFFDDQLVHLDPAREFTPSVHIPFGAINSAASGGDDARAEKLAKAREAMHARYANTFKRLAE